MSVDNSRVVLNVGGSRFETTLQTLKSIPNTYFASLLNGSWKDSHPNGEIFIDRSPKHFEHILEYLRSRVIPQQIPTVDRAYLNAEAAFYNLPELLDTELKKGNLVRLTENTVHELGNLLGRQPVITCFMCKDHRILDAHGVNGVCSFCSEHLEGTWNCVKDVFQRGPRDPALIESTKEKSGRHTAARSLYRISKKYSHCLLLQRIVPRSCDDQYLHIPDDFVERAEFSSQHEDYFAEHNIDVPMTDSS